MYISSSIEDRKQIFFRTEFFWKKKKKKHFPSVLKIKRRKRFQLDGPNLSEQKINRYSSH